MTAIPTFPIFRRLTRWDREVIEAITRQFPPYSDFGFSSLWAWDTDETCTISMLGGNLVVRLKDFLSDNHFYSFIGQDAVIETVAVLLAHARQEGIAPELRLIPECVIAADDRLRQHFAVAADRDNFDYIYEAADWAHFPGPRFRKHRKMLRRCQAQAEIELRHLDPGNLLCQEAMNELFHRWAEQKRACTAEDYRPEWTALQRLYALAGDGGLAACGCYHRDLLVGFSIWEVLPVPGGTCAVGHFQKADRAYEGLSSWQTRALGELLVAAVCPRINGEQDLGIPGLRAYKASLQPRGFLRKYAIAERSACWNRT